MRYRTAVETDLDGIIELLRDLHADDEPAPSHERLEIVWREISANRAIHVFIAERGGGLVAACHLVVVPNLTRGTRPYGWIENVVTRRECRRQGIGAGLLRYALEAAWSLDCYKVMLMTGRAREDVHRFYEGVGFMPDLKKAFVAKPGVS